MAELFFCVLTQSGPQAVAPESGLSGHGRNTGCPVPPAQIPACAANALGSSLEYERQSGNKGEDVIIELSGRNARLSEQIDSSS